MFPGRRRDNPHALFVGMIDIRLGDRVAQIGCADGSRLAAIAGKVGLSGRAVVVVDDEASAARAKKGAEHGGVLVEIEQSPLTTLPLDDGSIDLVVIDDTGGRFSNATPETRAALIKEVLRALRPGGRVMVIGAAARGGLGALLSRAQQGPSVDPEPWLQSDGFTAVRRLAEREQLQFTEGIKPRK